MENKHKFRPNLEHLNGSGSGSPAPPPLRLQDRAGLCLWILQYSRFYGGKIHPKFLDQDDVERFLSHVATKRRVAAATPKQALSTLVFLNKEVFDTELGCGVSPEKSKRKINPPTVLTQQEVAKALGQIKGIHAPVAKLLGKSQKIIYP